MLCGDIPTDPSRPIIILCNHQIDSDWWFLFQMARSAQAAGNIKIVLKEQLKYVPIVGWGMRWFEFLFLRRRLDHDLKHIRDYMQSLIQDEFPFWLVFFPEGTTIHKEYVEKSKMFAEKQGRPKFEKVLLPRVAGLQVILDAVDAAEPDIYDMTIAFPSYSGEIPTTAMGYTRKHDTEIPSMKTLLARRSSRKPIWIHGQKFEYQHVKEDLQTFLDTRWKAKEELLKHFTKHQKFPSSDSARHVVLPASKSIVLKLWIGFFCLCIVLPFVTLSFLPLYTFWVIYCFIYSIFDRTTSFLWPYLLQLIETK
ncbi:unnamed protein product [Albugo candida]|uniref:Phospholipid/glycerol acyltransferase domain-containing protein n=1 Tax=Albugo candida TaxID=65357 RepID=A0A024G5U4_9STRA|nr:unnamed protein product [Albugo candida]|eukprot:CCI42137.1 unnamed protein product [Albugo candida]